MLASRSCESLPNVIGLSPTAFVVEMCLERRQRGSEQDHSLPLLPAFVIRNSRLYATPDPLRVELSALGCRSHDFIACSSNALEEEAIVDEDLLKLVLHVGLDIIRQDQSDLRRRVFAQLKVKAIGARALRERAKACRLVEGEQRRSEKGEQDWFGRRRRGGLGVRHRGKLQRQVPARQWRLGACNDLPSHAIGDRVRQQRARADPAEISHRMGKMSAGVWWCG